MRRAGIPFMKGGHHDDGPHRRDETRLERDTAYRFGYLAEFIGFGTDDLDAIHAAAAHLGPLVPALVDAVYDKVFSYDATKRHFVPRETGYGGPVPAGIDSLSLQHPMIAFRKQHLGRYLTRLVTGTYDADLVDHLDMVGKIHTPAAGSRELDVPLVQMNALLGFVATAIVGPSCRSGWIGAPRSEPCSRSRSCSGSRTNWSRGTTRRPEPSRARTPRAPV